MYTKKICLREMKECRCICLMHLTGLDYLSISMKLFVFMSSQPSSLRSLSLSFPHVGTEETVLLLASHTDLELQLLKRSVHWTDEIDTQLTFPDAKFLSYSIPAGVGVRTVSPIISSLLIRQVIIIISSNINRMSGILWCLKSTTYHLYSEVHKKLIWYDNVFV